MDTSIGSRIPTEHLPPKLSGDPSEPYQDQAEVTISPDFSMEKLGDDLGYAISEDFSLQKLGENLDFKLTDGFTENASLNMGAYEEDLDIEDSSQVSPFLREDFIISDQTRPEIKRIPTTREHKRMKRLGSALGLMAIATTAFFVAPVAQKALPFWQPKVESTSSTTAPSTDQQSVDLRALSVVWNAKKLGQTIQSAPNFTIPDTTTPELIEKAGTLKIRPQPNFLTPEGALVSPDYILSLPTTGASIFGYERPQEEEELIYDGVNKSVLNTLTAAQVPQQRTPQVEAFAAANPSYKPPWETQYKGYRSSDLQPTAMHQFSTQDDLPLSPYPGELGGSAYFETHYQTYGRGGGTLPALKPGDPLVIERKIDDNIYTFAYIGSETIEVNKADGSLTPAEIKRQMDRGYGPDVTFDQIARTWQGHENQITATIQACNGSTQRVLYRFDLVDQKLTTKWID